MRTIVDAGVADIANSSTLDHVPHGESLDGLVFGNAARAIRATDGSSVSAAIFVAAVISSFLCLREGSVGSQLVGLAAYHGERWVR